MLVERSQISSVSIETFYLMVCPEIESRQGQNSQPLSTLALGSKQPLAEWVMGLFPEGKRPGCGLDRGLLVASHGHFSEKGCVSVASRSV